MAITSFERKFVVTEARSAKRLAEDMRNPSRVTAAKRDYAKDRQKGVKALKQRFSGLETC